CPNTAVCLVVAGFPHRLKEGCCSSLFDNATEDSTVYRNSGPDVGVISPPGRAGSVPEGEVMSRGASGVFEAPRNERLPGEHPGELVFEEELLFAERRAKLVEPCRLFVVFGEERAPDPIGVSPLQEVERKD